jgi:pimeloyl-ACP methyl ester carboxylesterase
VSGTIETVEVAGGVRLAVADAGSGPAVVLLHGWPVTSLHWWLAVPALTAAGYRAICADLRGQGASEGPGTFAKEELARDVVALAARFGLARFALVGHDWGGTVGYLVAADHRDRVAALVVEEELLPGSGVPIPEPGRSRYPDWHGPFQTPGAGHYPAEQRADLVNPALVAFLNEHRW